MRKEELKNSVYLIKGDDKDYSLTKDREDKINSLEINDEHKEFFKNIFKDEPTPKPSDLLVEVVGQKYFVKFSLISDHRIAAGQFIAIYNKLRAEQGVVKEYIDARVEEKIFYK